MFKYYCISGFRDENVHLLRSQGNKKNTGKGISDLCDIQARVILRICPKVKQACSPREDASADETSQYVYIHMSTNTFSFYEPDEHAQCDVATCSQPHPPKKLTSMVLSKDPTLFLRPRFPVTQPEWGVLKFQHVTAKTQTLVFTPQDAMYMFSGQLWGLGSSLPPASSVNIIMSWLHRCKLY